MGKKVLIITYYWPPSGGAGVQRFLKFVKYLPQFNIKPYVLTVENPTYPIVDESLDEEISKDLAIFKSKTFEPFALYALLTGKTVSDSTNPTIELNASNWKNEIGSWIRANLFIPDARLGWLLTARSKALSIVQEHNIDTIITTGPPHSTHFVGRYVKNKTSINWIADFRDPWTQIYYNESLPRTSLVEKLDKKMEQSVLREADKVSVISPSMKKLQTTIFNRNYHVISNGFDHEDFNRIDKKITDENSIIIRHIGSLGELSVPYNFFKALSELPDSNRLNVEFIGNVHQGVSQQIEQYDLQNTVKIKSYIPHEQAIQSMKDADFLLLIIPNSTNNELILTGKIFEYIGTQNPIILIGPDGDAKDILVGLGHNCFFNFDDKQGLKELLTKIDSCEFEKPTLTHLNDLKNHPFSRYQLTKELSQII